MCHNLKNKMAYGSQKVLVPALFFPSHEWHPCPTFTSHRAERNAAKLRQFTLEKNFQKSHGSFEKCGEDVENLKKVMIFVYFCCQKLIYLIHIMIKYTYNSIT